MTRVFPGTLRGYRSWYLSPRGTLLSLTNNHTWTSSIQTAECPFISHPLYHGGFAPFPNCTCGFYAFYEPNMASDYMEPYFKAKTINGYLIGAISAHDYIIPHRRGFRAQTVQIEALAYFKILPELTHPLLSSSHRVDLFHSFEELVEEYPPQDVSGLVSHDSWTYRPPRLR